MNVLGFCKRLGKCIQISRVVRHIALEHRSYGSIEALDLAVLLAVVRQVEVVRDLQNMRYLLVELRREQRSNVGEDVLQRAVWEHPVRFEGLTNVQAGSTLQKNDLRELGKLVNDEKQETVPSLRARKWSTEIDGDGFKTFGRGEEAHLLFLPDQKKAVIGAIRAASGGRRIVGCNQRPIVDQTKPSK